MPVQDIDKITHTPTQERGESSPKPSLRPYDGREDIFGWMHHAEMVAKMSGWSQGTLAMMTQVTLVGEAARWWSVEARTRDIEEDISWPMLKGLMIEQYAGATAEELLDQAYATSQGKRRVREYLAELKSIFVRIPDLSEREKLRIFLRNLRPELSRWVRSIGVADLTQAIEIASRAEQGVCDPGSTLESRIARMEQDLQSLRWERGGSSNRHLGERVGHNSCYACGEVGHRTQQCPKGSRRLQSGAGRR